MILKNPGKRNRSKFDYSFVFPYFCAKSKTHNFDLNFDPILFPGFLKPQLRLEFWLPSFSFFSPGPIWWKIGHVDWLMLIANPKKALNLKVQVEVKKARKDKMGLKRSGPVSVNAISGEQNLTPCFTMTSEECLTYHQNYCWISTLGSSIPGDFHLGLPEDFYLGFGLQKL